MRDELRRALFAAAFAAAALAGGCGGGGGGGSPAPAPAPGPPPPPPPPPPPAAAGTYFLAARAGGSGTAPLNNIPFPTGPVGASKFMLAYIDSANPPLPFNFTNVSPNPNQLEAVGLGYDFGTFSEYFPASAGGTATGWGTRYQVYADVGPSGTGPGALYAVDLRKPTPLAAPVATQISSGTVTSLKLCSSPAASLFDNYRTANQSWIVFHAVGPDNNCGSIDDTFVAVQMSMSSATGALPLAQGSGTSALQIEPVEALHDTFGTITGFLAIAHPPCTDINCTAVTSPVSLQKLDASFANPATFATRLNGLGQTGAGGEFVSLGVAGNVWLYVDGNGIYSANWSSPTTASTLVYQLMAGESVLGRAVFDGANAYVAISSMTGSYVKMINTSTNMVTATQAVDATSTQIALVGVTSANLVYLSQNGSAIKSLAKTTLTGLTILNKTLSGTQSIDSLMVSGGASGPAAAFLVGDTVYFTVADSSASGATGLAKQAFFAAASGAANSATAVATGVSAVLGVVAPATIPTSGPITFAGALVMTGGANGATAGQAEFANGSPAVTASLGLYSSAGALTTTIGTLSSTNVANGPALALPITGVALNGGPVQQAMPATLLLFGTDGTGAAGQDIAIFSSDNSTPFAQISGFDQ